MKLTNLIRAIHTIFIETFNTFGLGQIKNFQVAAPMLANNIMNRVRSLNRKPQTVHIRPQRDEHHVKNTQYKKSYHHLMYDDLQAQSQQDNLVVEISCFS